MMSPQYELLAAEIERVVSSPYPTQLKTLHDIVAHQCTSGDIERWAASKPCLVDRLADCILNGLGTWPYVLRLLEQLSNAARIRDALLKQQPCLLQQLLLQALDGDDLQSSYAAAVTSLLSNPLDQEFALPASAQSFFVRVFEHAAQNPSTANIKPAYRILRGCSRHLIGILSNETLIRFESIFLDILRNARADDQCLSMYCLDMMREIILAFDEASMVPSIVFETQDFLTNAHQPNNMWSPVVLRQFFSEDKAAKTLQLITLRAYWACKESGSSEDLLDSLKLANRIVLAVQQHVRHGWSAANSALLRKLQDRALAPGVNAHIQIEALSLIGKLCEVRAIPLRVRDCVRGLLTDPRRLFAQIPFVKNEGLLDNFAPILDAGLTAEIVDNILDHTMNAEAVEVVQSSRSCTYILESLGRLSIHNSGASAGIMETLKSHAALNKLSAIGRRLTGTQGGVADSIDDTCPSTLLRARMSIIQAFCSVGLRSAALRADQSPLSPATVDEILSLHSLSAQQNFSCEHVKKTGFYAPRIFVQEEIPGDAGMEDWRNNLEHHLRQKTLSDHERLVSIFSKACINLESRCESVEAPLREEHDRRYALRAEHDDLLQAYRELESQAIEDEVDRNALRAEKEEVMRDLACANEENESLLEKVRVLQDDLYRDREKARGEFDQLERSKEMAELDHAAAFATKQEEADELCERHTNMSLEFERMKADLNVLNVQLRDARQEVKDVRTERDKAYQSSEIGKQQLEEAITARQHLTKLHSQLEDEMQAFKTQRNADLAEHEQTTQNIRDEAASSLHRTLERHHEEVDALKARYQKEADDLGKRLSDLRAESQQAHEQLGANIAERDQKIANYKAKIERLSRKCDLKDQQIAQANAMRNNLISALNPTAFQPPAELPPRSKSSSGETQNTDDQTELSPATPLPSDDMHVEVLEPAAEGVSGSPASWEPEDGSTPKRPRPRQSLNRKARSSVGYLRTDGGPSLGTKSARASILNVPNVQRQPLAVTSVNRSPVKSSMKTPKQSNAQKAVAYFNDPTIDGSEVFTGTRREKALGDEMEEDFETDT